MKLVIFVVMTMFPSSSQNGTEVVSVFDSVFMPALLEAVVGNGLEATSIARGVAGTLFGCRQRGHVFVQGVVHV